MSNGRRRQRVGASQRLREALPRGFLPPEFTQGIVSELPWGMLLALLLVAGLWAGMQNTLAGGGSFITLPALILSGMSPLAANITSTVALFPGQVTSGFAGRSLVSGVGALSFRALFILSLVGGAVGGLLLLNTPPSVFAHMVPWLVLFATAAFAWGSFFRKATHEGGAVRPIGAVPAGAVQMGIAIYGGYLAAASAF